jgi:hypothetical protein
LHQGALKKQHLELGLPPSHFPHLAEHCFPWPTVPTHHLLPLNYHPQHVALAAREQQVEPGQQVKGVGPLHHLEVGPHQVGPLQASYATTLLLKKSRIQLLVCFLQ